METLNIKNIEIKRCVVCNEEKPVSKFYKQTKHVEDGVATVDGHRVICMKCNREGWVEPVTYAELASYTGHPATVEEINAKVAEAAAETKAAKVSTEPVAAGTKVCKMCGETKAVIEYTVNRANKDGRCRECKACVKEYRAARKAAKAAQQLALNKLAVANEINEILAD